MENLFKQGAKLENTDRVTLGRVLFYVLDK